MVLYGHFPLLLYLIYINKKYTMTYIVKWEELKVVVKRRII